MRRTMDNRDPLRRPPVFDLCSDQRRRLTDAALQRLSQTLEILTGTAGSTPVEHDLAKLATAGWPFASEEHKAAWAACALMHSDRAAEFDFAWEALADPAAEFRDRLRAGPPLTPARRRARSGWSARPST